MSCLRTECGTLELENPFILASAPPTASYELIRRGFIQGWAGAVTKTVKPDSLCIVDVSPRYSSLRGRTGEVFGFENIELVSPRDVAYWAETLALLKREFPRKVLIASIMGDTRRDSWVELAARMEAAGADALELNFSCPHGMPEMGVGAAIGQSAEISARITGWVRSCTRLPVIVKLTPNVTDVVPIARAVSRAGADILAAINTVESITSVDLDTLEPQPAVDGLSTYGGYSGRGVKPIGLRVVSQIARSVDIPIMGMGGISTWSDAAEYIALGASAVQVCTEVMLKGFGIVEGMKTGLADYFREKAISGTGRLRGKALKRLTSHDMLPRPGRSFPAVADARLCTRCGRCVTACRDGSHAALRLAGACVEFDRALCDSCSLCTQVCPSGALAMTGSTAAERTA